MDDFFKTLHFPYEQVRSGQDEFIRRVYKAIEEKRNILISAPTGSGKTISALAPALHLGKKLNKTVICLTSRQTQANQVIKTIHDLAKKSQEKINYIAFIGKRNMCSHEERDLYPATDFLEFCRKTREGGKCSYYKNVRNGDYEEHMKGVINKATESFIDVEGFVKLASRATPEEGVRGYCPYELAARKAYKTDVVICDYNYLFGPGMMETFLGKIGRELHECIVVVDEAHNLPDRIRSSFTYTLSTDLTKLAARELHDTIKGTKYDLYISNLSSILEDLFIQRIEEKKEEHLIPKEEFTENYMKRFVSEIKLKDAVDMLREAEVLIKEDKLVSQVGKVASFLERWNEMDEENFIRILRKEQKNDKTTISLEIKCIDPGAFATDVLNGAHSSILMSGTLSPIEMFRDVLAIKNADLLELESPFSKEQQLTLVQNEVTTQYSKRSPQMYKDIAEQIKKMLFSASEKNALVFFPSYSLMDEVMKYIPLSSLHRKIIKELRNMTKEQKEAFVEQLRNRDPFSAESNVLFAVTSGSFAEGLDLPGDALEMVLVVGLPLAVPDATTNAVIKHYEKKFRKGELYGYVYPAMTKIIQAAGRCIRTEEDKGVVVLMDYRFLFPKYALSFPKHWHLKTSEFPEREIENFFD
jgi:DNA excision repair protein ERCC-2